MESVHKFRTTTRRLQTLLEQLVPEGNHDQKKVLKMLDRIRRRAGKLRDLDVQLAALRSLKVPQEPRRKTQLMQGLIELRAEHEKRLRKTLTKDMLREIRRRLKRASREVKLKSGVDALAIARKMLAQVEFPSNPPTEDTLHQYRIAVKRARYVAEFAPKSAETTQFAAQLQRLQDAIGHWHDWMILTGSAAERLGDVNQSSLVAALQSVTRGKFRHAVAVLAASPLIRSSQTPVVPPTARSRRMGTKSPTSVERTDSAA